jgi:hypothetical protein
MARGVGANHEASKGMPDENVSLARRDIREHRRELVNDLLEGSGT